MVADVDSTLLEKFRQGIWKTMPHPEETGGGEAIVNATTMTDLTEDLRDCAMQVYKAKLPDDLKILGKFDSELPTGSIKARPAVYIIHEAIRTGKLKGGQTVIEATSGNFGIALGEIAKMGLTVVSLVSRRLQEGVFEELRNGDIKVMDLDMDVCPAPGMEGSKNMLAARAAAANIRSQLADMGFDPAAFDAAYQEIEELLAAQDIINLAKVLARIYGMFCPEQYDNEMNIEAHRRITAAEMDQQLHADGQTLGEYKVFCAFGTGGTSGGIDRYIHENYGKKSVHVVFPPAGQDVAGIRTKNKASGLGLYRPESYAGEHEVDFEHARPLLKFLADRGHDIGESSALALYAATQMAHSGNGTRFVVIVADGIQKYKKSMEEAAKRNHRTQVSLKDAASEIAEYENIVWVHTQYTPKEEGLELIAKSLGVDKSKITVPKASTINRMLMTQQVPEDLAGPLGKGKSLLVCMAGNTSLMAVNILAGKGMTAESLNGGITNLPDGMGVNPGRLVKVATE